MFATLGSSHPTRELVSSASDAVVEERRRIQSSFVVKHRKY